MNNNNFNNNNNNNNNNYYNNNNKNKNYYNNNYNNNNNHNNNGDYNGDVADPDLDALTNLIVNNLPKTMDSNELKSLFEKFGSIETCKVVFNRKKDGSSNHSNHNNNNNNLGYGFVKYHKKEDATMAIEQMNGYELEDKPLKVSYAQASSSQSSHANLYINRLEPHVTNANLKEVFGAFGDVIDTKILTDPETGASRCVGFVHFAQRREALKAVSSMNGANIPFQSAPIYVKFANQMNGGNNNNNNNNNGGYNDNNDNNIYNNNYNNYNDNNNNNYNNYNDNNNNNNYNNYNDNNNNGYNNNNMNMNQMNNYNNYNNNNNGYNNNNNNNNNNNYYNNNDQYNNNNFNNNNNFGNNGNNNNNMNDVNNMTVYPIHISNLPNNVDETFLYKLFAFGAISGVQLLNNGQAVINYLDYQSVNNAINNLNGKIISGRSLKVICLTNSNMNDIHGNNNNNNNNHNNNTFY